MDPILIGTAVSEVSYTTLLHSFPHERNKVGVRDYKTQGETKISASILADVQKYTPKCFKLTW